MLNICKNEISHTFPVGDFIGVSWSLRLLPSLDLIMFWATGERDHELSLFTYRLLFFLVVPLPVLTDQDNLENFKFNPQGIDLVLLTIFRDISSSSYQLLLTSQPKD